MSHDAASTTHLTAVLFRYDRGAGEVVDRYCNAERPITHAQLGVLTPEPTLTLHKFEVGGNTDPDEVEVQMRYRTPSREPLATYANGAPHAPISVEIWQLLDSDPDGTEELLYQGRLDELRLDAQGVATLKVAGVKNLLLDRPLGLAATTRCGLRYGSTLCGIDLEAEREDGTISAIAGTEVTLTGLTTTTAGYWHRGYAQLGGLRILIREHLSGSVIKLQRAPPADWSGQVVTLTPGCDKDIATCRTKGNEEHFLGCGIAIPAANPLVSGL